jgi:hypothetical protein
LNLKGAAVKLRFSVVSTAAAIVKLRLRSLRVVLRAVMVPLRLRSMWWTAVEFFGATRPGVGTETVVETMVAMTNETAAKNFMMMAVGGKGSAGRRCVFGERWLLQTLLEQKANKNGYGGI